MNEDVDLPAEGSDGTPPLFTVGHSTRTVAELVRLLQAGGVNMVVDVRTVPRSRTNPQFNADALPASLADYQVGYERIEALGGLRGRSKTVPREVNAFWRNDSFHAYADHALGESFRSGLERLEALSAERRCAIMCAEAVWWRCHRRIIADYMLHRGRAVFHLMGDDRVDPARMTPAAVPAPDGLHYPAA